MSAPKDAEPVKLISSIFSTREDLIKAVTAGLGDMFGPLDWISAGLFFDRTRYYEKEMGWPLFRRFVAFRDLIRPESIVEVKLRTNELENAFVRDGKRSVNIDPGYICLERLVLVTGKNYTHRIYLSKGIYADLTLLFQRGCFRPLPWTYQDYGDEGLISQFNEIRANYKAQLRKDIA
jgi:hypothetical protein